MATDPEHPVIEPSWEAVLTAANERPLTFQVARRTPDGYEVWIANTDGTMTIVHGAGLTTTGRRADGTGSNVRFTGGTISALEHMAADGTVLAAFDGLDVPAASHDGQASFSSPDDDMTSIGWALRDHRPAAGVPPPGTAQSNISPYEPAQNTAPHPGDDEAVLPRPSRGVRGGNVNATAFLFVLAPVLLGVLLAMFLTTDTAETLRARLRPTFAQPVGLPYPADNVPSAARIGLGKRLFEDVQLSRGDALACASCHLTEKGLSDGVAHHIGIEGVPMLMHSPTLWNLAWSNALAWDGRAPTLEAVALYPPEGSADMGTKIEPVIKKLAADKTYLSAFAAAFPETPEITNGTISKAIASYMRSLVSPATRFDQWMAGNGSALTAAEKNGFTLFVGKAGCSNCHAGWAFTDYAFHDIGLPGDDRGRGYIIDRPALNHAFKTPTLRELAWRAPYMHDGSMPTLEAVVRHYEKGGVNRPTRSPDMKRGFTLSDGERGDLLAFLLTLSSAKPPLPPSEVASVATRGVPILGSQNPRVGQKNKQFSQERVHISAGQSVIIVNDDIQAHNVFVQDPRMTYDSGWQQPGAQVSVQFPIAGDYQVFCGIHPNMRLHVEVEPAAN